MLGPILVRLIRGGIGMAIGVSMTVGFTPLASADTYRWYYKPNYGVDAEAQPLALYSLPDTLAAYVLECNWRARTVDLVAFEGDVYEGERRFEMRVGPSRFVGTERLDPPDAIVTSRVSVPLDDPVITRLGTKPQRIAVIAADWPRSLPGSPIIARVVNECRALARSSEGQVTPAEPSADN